MKLSQIFIAEAQDYSQMFNDVRQYVEANSKSPESKEKTFRLIDGLVHLAKTNLKRNDRVVWFLRYAKVCAWATILREEGLTKEQIAKHPYIDNFTRKSQPREANTIIPATSVVELYGMVGGVTSMATELGHYLSLNIDKMTNYVFGWQWSNDIIMDFHKYEQEWKARQKAKISHYDLDQAGEKVIIDFGNDWYWIDLGRQSCRTEGDAMGHCGNSASAREGDRVLSLRELITDKDGKHWVPHLTFILDKDGFLGETKGRNNNKPSQKYHDMIIALLNTELVKGIKGGGYAPQNNFKLTDLTDEQQASLEGKLEQKQESTIASVYNNGLNEYNGEDFADLVNCIYDPETNALDTENEIDLEHQLHLLMPDRFECIMQYIDYNDQAMELDEYEIEGVLQDVAELIVGGSYADLVSIFASMLDKIDPEQYKTLSEFDNTLPLFDFNIFNPSVFIKAEEDDGDNWNVRAASKLIGQDMLKTRLKDIMAHFEQSYSTGGSSYPHRHKDGKVTEYIEAYEVQSSMEAYESAEDAEENFNPNHFVNYSHHDSGFRGDHILDDGMGIFKPEDWQYAPDDLNEDQMGQLMDQAIAYLKTEESYKNYLASLKPKPETTEN